MTLKNASSIVVIFIDCYSIKIEKKSSCCYYECSYLLLWCCCVIDWLLLVMLFFIDNDYKLLICLMNVIVYRPLSNLGNSLVNILTDLI